MGITPPPSGPSARIELAVEEAAVARQAGRYREAIERTAAAGALLGSGPVRRELRVALAREAGLGWIGLDRPREAHDQLMLALERAGGEPALVDPVRGALAELELMRGDAREARRWLADRGRDRRATLLAQARLELYEGDVAVAEQALQGCEQAPFELGVELLVENPDQARNSEGDALHLSRVERQIADEAVVTQEVGD